MSPEPELRDGLYECSGCGMRYDAEKSLDWCCNGDEEQRRGIWRGVD